MVPQARRLRDLKIHLGLAHTLATARGGAQELHLNRATLLAKHVHPPEARCLIVLVGSLCGVKYCSKNQRVEPRICSKVVQQFELPSDLLVTFR